MVLFCQIICHVRLLARIFVKEYPHYPLDLQGLSSCPQHVNHVHVLHQPPLSIKGLRLQQPCHHYLCPCVLESASCSYVCLFVLVCLQFVAHCYFRFLATATFYPHNPIRTLQPLQLFASLKLASRNARVLFLVLYHLANPTLRLCLPTIRCYVVSLNHIPSCLFFVFSLLIPPSALWLA
ncbi:hypothetical protein BC835DRAFT_453850 [Cytidiella melzeri]|nr:hypothetical protein BC835DRAFT_453850 [Cytidiella melzeri]